MKRHNLTESAALVQMIKQFFDGEQPQFNSELKTEVEEIVQEQLKLFQEDIDLLKEQIALKAQDVGCSECQHKWTVEVTMDQTNFFGKGS